MKQHDGSAHTEDHTTRDHIVRTADRLFYQRGYDHTSFADIASLVKISRGNFYYHFKTKDELLDAVIAARVTKTAMMLETWEVVGEGPNDRIESFIQLWVTNRADIARYGCPVGTLCIELAKLDHPAQADARELFTLFRVWLRRQFALLGYEKEADGLAMELLVRSQGVASLAAAFGNAAVIDEQARQMREWLRVCIDAAPPRRTTKRSSDRGRGRAGGRHVS